ncbi:MAG: mechanosensitive ion channel family protein [Chloroflexi bacterium]|nr:MAG: mechanosensitive ion channel family protein [Chloroflexota bacterium]
MFEWFFGLLIGWGVGDVTAVYLSRLICILLILILGFVAYFIARRYLLRLVTYSVERTATSWDDSLHKKGVFNRLAQLAPAMVIYLLLPFALEGHQNWINFANNVVFVYAIVMIVLAINAFFSAVEDILFAVEWSRELPVRSFVQVLKLIAIVIGVLVVATILLGETLAVLFGSIGAVTAVLTIVFQDFLLGLVAGLQLTSTDMILRGDWITVPKYDADGTILEIGLTTIKIQNADKSITTLPTQSLITESFKNWRGMQESDGRRIKRCIHIDLNSVQPMNDEMLTQLRQANLLPSGEESTVSIYPTNVGAYRAYIEAYLQNHPQINTEMTMLVRQLASDRYGLPIEVYAFSIDKDFVPYEQIQASIFEHLLIALPKFNLRAYQAPTGYDLGGKTAVSS